MPDALTEEILALGVPKDCDLNTTSMLVAMGCGMLDNLGASKPQMQSILELACLFGPQDPYDLDMADDDTSQREAMDLVHETIGQIAEVMPRVMTAMRMMRGSFCELVFELEDHVDVDMPPAQVFEMARNALGLMFNTYYAVLHP